MKTNLLRLFIMLFALSLVVTSCENVNLTDPEADKESVDDNALGERAVGDVFGFVNDGQSGKKLSSCPTKTWTGNPMIGWTMTLDFGEEGSACTTGGVERTGKIIATFGGLKNWANGTPVAVTFENYVVDGDKVEGNIVVSMATVGEFSIAATGMKITFDDGKTMTWTSTKTIKADGTNWIIDGDASGTLRNGKTFVRKTEGLTKSPDCEWFVDGEVTLTIGSGEDVSIYSMDYESCGVVEITYNGISYTQNFNE